MPLTVDFEDAHIELGPTGKEDKWLAFRAEDPAGDPAVVDSVTLKIHSPSGVVTKTEDDFDRYGVKWVYQIRFDEAGLWRLELSATGRQHGLVENVVLDRLLVRE